MDINTLHPLRAGEELPLRREERVSAGFFLQAQDFESLHVHCREMQKGQTNTLTSSRIVAARRDEALY